MLCRPIVSVCPRLLASAESDAYFTSSVTLLPLRNAVIAAQSAANNAVNQTNEETMRSFIKR
jgi:hypothetical protein